MLVQMHSQRKLAKNSNALASQRSSLIIRFALISVMIVDHDPLAEAQLVPQWVRALTQANNPLLYNRVLTINDMVFCAPKGTHSAIAQLMEASSAPAIAALSKFCFPIHPTFPSTKKIPDLFYVLPRCSWLGGLDPHGTTLSSSG